MVEKRTIPYIEIIKSEDVPSYYTKNDLETLNCIISFEIDKFPYRAIGDIVDENLSNYIPECKRNDPLENLIGYYKSLNCREDHNVQ